MDKLREEELKCQIGKIWFENFNTAKKLGNVDFCVSIEQKQAEFNFSEYDDGTHSFMWAEAKKGTKADIIESFIQLILTIGKEKNI